MGKLNTNPIPNPILHWWCHHQLSFLRFLLPLLLLSHLQIFSFWILYWLLVSLLHQLLLSFVHQVFLLLLHLHHLHVGFLEIHQYMHYLMLNHHLHHYEGGKDLAQALAYLSCL